MVQRQHDLAGALIDGGAAQPAEHRDFLRTGQPDPLHLGVGDILDVFLDLFVHRAIVRVHTAKFQEFVNRHLVPRQLGIRRLDHSENVQHQLLLAQRQAVHGILDQVVGFAHNGLVAPGAVGSDRGQNLVIGPWGVWLFFGCHSVTSIFPAAMFGCAKMGVLAHSLRR